MPIQIVINTFNPSEVVNLFADYFRTKILSRGAEKRIIIPKSLGTGFIGGIDFRDGLGMLLVDCKFNRDVVLRYVSKDFQPLRMIFCVENEFVHIIKADRMQYQLNYMLGSMVSGTCNNEQVFIFPADKQIHYYSIEINRQRYLNKISDSLKLLPMEIKEVFTDVECTRSFLYQGNYSLSIAECIQNIKINDYEGLVRRIFIEAQTLEILAMQIGQYIDDLEPSRKQTMLRKRDIELIIQARNRLFEDLINPPTIKELAQIIGTNENKLKTGFRKLYNSTINNLLLDHRLNRAKILIAEGNYPIKEISKMVGYKHAGHFTSKFREKFGVLPRDFLKSIE